METTKRVLHDVHVQNKLGSKVKRKTAGGSGWGDGGGGGERQETEKKKGGWGEGKKKRERERELELEHFIYIILKDSSVRSSWTYLTASPGYTTNTNKHNNTTNKY